MSTETVEIIVRETGSAQAATGIRGMGNAAGVTHAQMDQLLGMMGNSNLKMAEIARAGGSVEQQMMRIGAATGVATAGHAAHNAEMQAGTQWAGHLREALVGIGLALGAKEWIELTDAYQKNVNGLKQVTTSAEELIAVQGALTKVSMDTFSSLDANTMLYVRLSKASKELGISQGEMLSAIKAMDSGLLKAGNSTEDASRAITGLSVALMTGSGTSRAMMAIMRQMPDLTQALADKFYGGKKSVEEFRDAVVKGHISMTQVMKAMSELTPVTFDFDRATKTLTDTTNRHTESVLSDYEQTLVAKGVLLDYSKVQADANKNVLDYSKVTTDAARNVVDLSGKAQQGARQVAAVGTEFKKTGADSHAALGQISDGITGMDTRLTAFEKSIKKIEPTVAMAWQNMKNALFNYVGAQDQASGASEKLAHVIQLAATNGETFFGVIQVITVFLTAYIARAGLAYAATLLFVSGFSPLTFVIALLAAATMAVLAFGRSMTLTADGSITALGALMGAIHLVLGALQALWDLAGQAPGYWGQATLAVTGFALALRVVLGLNVLNWLTSAISMLASFAVATWTAIGPIGVMVAAATALALAVAYLTGNLDSAIATLKDKLTPVIDKITEKMKEATKETQKQGLAAKEWGDTFAGEVTPKVVNAFDTINAATNKAAATQQALGTTVADTSASIQSQYDAMAAKVAQDSQNMVQSINSVAGATASASNATSKWTNSFTSGTDMYRKLLDDQARMQKGGDPTAAYDFQQDLAYLQTVSGSSKLLTQVPNFQAIRDILKQAGFTPLSFASGGSFTVRGDGGTDSQLVKFMATPGERVTVETPSQQNASGGSKGGGDVKVFMTVMANDAASFSRTQRQLATSLESELQRVRSRGG